jgi:Tol biopolymer transport system component
MSRRIAALALPGLVVLLALTTAAGADHSSGTSERNAEFGPWSTPVNLGPIVNSTVNDAGPAISRDGLSLYFHSQRTGPTNADLHVSRRAAIDLPWEAPVNLGTTVSSDLPEAVPTLSKNGHYLFFGSLRAGTWDIYVSLRRHTHDDFGWETPIALPSPINGSSFDVPSDYFEDPHGRAQLYFASDRGTGLGAPGLDIYVTELQRGGTWSAPVYVAALNSAFQEARPAIRADGLEVIFDSSREGNLDLYVSRRRHTWEPWSAPENLGPAVNSTAGDIHPALSGNGRTLYFASARSGSLGSFDLYASARSRVVADDRPDDDH